MNRLLILELEKLAKVFLMTYVIAFIPFYLWNFSLPLIILPAISVAMASQILKRSAWYLALPWSRGKIILFVIYQNTVIFLLSLFLTFVILAFRGYFSEQEYGFTVFLFLLISFSGYIFCSQRLLAGIALKSQIVKQGFNLRSTKASVFFLGLYVLVWYFELLQEPTFWLIGIITALIVLVIGLCREFVLPSSNKKVVTKTTIFIGAIVIALSIGSAIFIANFKQPTGRLVHKSVDLLNNFPSFMSKERAQFLFVESDIGDAPAMLKHRRYLQEKVTFDSWKDRTILCKSSGCLSLSADVVATENLSTTELEERFLVLMKLCNFKMDEFGLVTCSGKKMDREHLQTWGNLLEKNGALSRWLVSSVPEKQIIALKALSLEMGNQQKIAIEELSTSSDPRVKTVAILLLSNLESYRKEALDCLSSKHLMHPVCLARIKENRM